MNAPDLFGFAPHHHHPADPYAHPDLLTDGTSDSWAVFSPDRRYRYLLARAWSAAPPLCFFMCNPSVADAFAPDPTVTRCIGFARRENAGGILIANAAAFVATDPREIAWRGDPIGPHNDAILRWALAHPGVKVAAWGHVAKRVRAVMEPSFRLITRHRGPGGLMCLGVTKAGEPRHPLMLAANTALREWPLTA